MKKQIVVLSLLVSVLGFAQEKDKKQTSQEKNIEEVTIRKKKQAVEQKADRTIYDFSEQEHLKTGTALEGIKKLPGLMNSDLTGMAYQGKSLEVFMDGRPLNINGTELNAFLEGMPATAIERIEVVTNPGAEFPATGGGAILNIITSRSAKSYLTATYSGNYSFTNYDKHRNKTNQSILLNSKNRWFGWQLNAGVNYGEGMERSELEGLNKSFNEDIRRGYFARTALSFDLGKDRLLFNYNINHNNNDELPFVSGILSGINYERLDQTDNKRLRQEGVLTYQKRFNDAGKKLDFKLSYIKADNDFEQDNRFYLASGTSAVLPKYTTATDVRTAEFGINYSQDLDLLDRGKLSLGGLYQRLDYEAEALGIKNLDYQRQTVASFAELQTSKGKFDFILGVRGEDYDISGVTYNATTGIYDALTTFKKYKLFPNASVQYNFNRMINLAVNYNKKISLPSISRLNPNSDYNNGNFYQVGNANLAPTIQDNLGVKISAFNYVFVSYDLGFVNEGVFERINRQGDVVAMESVNLPYHRFHNFAAGVPFPLAIFNKSLKEIMMSNPDKMNLLYFVAVYNRAELADVDNKGLWYFNVNGQFTLPKEVKLNLNYSLIPGGITYYYYGIDRPVQNNLSVTLSKKFMKDRLNVSLFAEDLFNTNRMGLYSLGTAQQTRMNMKGDSRTFGVSVNYKIPTKNRLAKENPNLLLESQQEGSGGMIK